MNDLISRQDAIDAITEIDDGFNCDIYTNEVREILRELPTADVAPVVHGKWLYKAWTYKGGDIGVFICSNCGHANWIKEHNFCPNCGASMTEGAEDGQTG